MKTVNKQPSVRVNLTAKRKLERIQAQTEQRQTVLLDRAIDLLEREMLAKQVEADFADLANSDKALRKYNKLSSTFEGTATDGLSRT
jgi:hypothetical protein